jgi:hypothetical protein
MYIYALLVLYSCFTSLDVCNCCHPVLLQYIHLYSCFTRTLLVLFLMYVCVCVCRLTGLVESVEQSEGLRRDGACEHAGLQQRPAGQAPLPEAAPVCLLMHVGAAQARTRLQERLRVWTAVQVRDACCSLVIWCPLTQSSLSASYGGGCSTRIHVDSGKYWGLVRLCGVMRWPGGLLYAARGP